MDLITNLITNLVVNYVQNVRSGPNLDRNSSGGSGGSVPNAAPYVLCEWLVDLALAHGQIIPRAPLAVKGGIELDF